MSAIAGIYHLNDEPINLEHGGRIMRDLEKYPADDVQTWHSDKVFLGCHAQWITPESVDERLPYYDRERKLSITADAIIDNREELFERLQIPSDKRKNITDSELILLSYNKWGEESPKFLVGDFAFMIWDERRKMLFGARDFSGSRTLYYYCDPNRIVFSTVIYPLFTLPYIDKQLNQQWLAEFLAIHNIFDTVDVHSTVYKNIWQVPPSHSISILNGKVKLSKYCTFKDIKKLELKSNKDYEEAFREVFGKSITSQIRSNRNVGARLSGGLDSGAVVSFAARALSKEKKQLHTFSSVPINGFVDWTSKRKMADERPYIQETVKHVGNIRDHYLNFDGVSSFSEINDLLETFEMPYKFFENSYWLKGIYEEASKYSISLLLNGSRGNYTISWGPALDYYANLLKKLNFIRLNHEINLYSKNIGVKKSVVLSAVGKRAYPQLDKILHSQDYPPAQTLINPDFAKKTYVFDTLKSNGIDITCSSVPNAINTRKEQFENLYYWNTNGTSKTKLSLRYSLSDRDPTNDLRVVKFCLSLPNEQFVQNGLDRSLIRRAMENYLPDKVRLNQRIRGIQGADGIQRMIPHWGAFVKEMKEICRDSIVAEFLDVQTIKASISKVENHPKPEYILYPELKILMRSLIVYRFIKNFP